MKILFDIEGDGLYEDCTQVWCVVAKDVELNRVSSFRPTGINTALDYLSNADLLIGHNIIGYDLPVLEKLYDFTFEGEVLDTLVLSRLLNPDRTRPFNCPSNIGPHSIESWALRLGGDQLKQQHEDWSQFSEEMLSRCVSDVDINERVYNELLKEMKQ